MSKLTVREALALEGAQEWIVDVWPKVGLDQPIRWVQCLDLDDIYEEATEGDWVIAKTVVDAGTEEEEHLKDIVENLVQRGAVALGFRVQDLPISKSIHGIGRHERMPLVALSARTPLLTLVEQLNRAIAERDLSKLRVQNEVTRILSETLAGGSGLRGLIESAARLVDAPVALLTPLGRVVAVAGLDPQQDLHRELVEGEGSLTADVQVGGRLWGTLVVGHVGSGAEVIRSSLLLALPTAVAIEVMRFSELVPAEERARRELVIDLLVGNIRRASELILRASFSEFHPQPGNDLVGLAMPLAPGIRLPVTNALGSLKIQFLEAELDMDLLLLVSLPESMEANKVVTQLVARLSHYLAATDAIPKPLVAIGPVVRDLGEAGRSLNEARNTLTLARDVGTDLFVVTAQHFGVDRLLARLLDDPELTRFCNELLEPVIHYDSRTNGALLRTLDTYLRNGSSKTHTATELHLRRQSLYRRLDRITELIGPLEDPEFRLGLQIALKAHRLIDSPFRPHRAESWWWTHPRVG